ncbi:MAG: TonB-dependent receptor, partial [Capnocytophaga sp.]|nr:TonB-dependent receptor [Capnocytophaga sp.]
IEEIEILNRYSDNRLLKDIEESNKVALNLKLNEKSKRVWFGNVDAAYGLVSENRYHLKTNLMNFGKENKYYFLSNLNNTGDDSFASSQNMSNPMRFDPSVKLGNDQSVTKLITLMPPNLGFKQIRSRINNTELISLNGIFNPTEKIKIKAQLLFNWDKIRFVQNTTNVVNTSSLHFTNTENYQLDNKEKVIFGKLDTSYDFTKTKMLQTSTLVNCGNFKDNAHLLFNGNSTIENLEHRNNLFDHRMAYTHKLKERNAILITGRYIRESAPQNYTVNQYFFNDLFPNFSGTNNVGQYVSGTMDFVGINAFFISRAVKKHLLEIQIGNEYKKEALQSQLSLFQDNVLIVNPADFQNQTTCHENDLYLKTNYTYHLSKNYTLTGKVDLHQFFNRFNDEEQHRQHIFYINPSVNLDWQINSNNLLNLSYSYNNSNAQITDIYNGFVMTRFNSFTKGIGDFSRLDVSDISLNYTLGSWSDRFFATAFLIYRKNHNFLSTEAFINEQFSVYKKIRIQDREMFIFNTKIDYYFKSLFTNLKLDLGYHQLDFKNKVNDSELRIGKSNSFTYGFELRSAFRGVFNYNIGSKWDNSQIKIASFSNSYTNNVSFADFSFVFSKKTTFKTQFERYFFGNLPTEKEYYFLDFELEHKFLDKKLTFALVGKNLLNTQVFRKYFISDIGSSTTEYRLLPRFALLRMIYQF